MQKFMEQYPAVVNLKNLKCGIEKFRKHEPWHKDFHAEYYLDLKEWQKNGLTNEWWNQILDDLTKSPWIAIRPKSKNFIRDRGKERLNKMREALSRIDAKDIESCNWNSVAALFNITHEIKNVTSPAHPAFASKICHFILPAIFPLFDNQALNLKIPNYEFYWNYCRQQWIHCNDKKQLKDTLRPCLGRSDISDYPWATRITELCIMGRN